MPACTFHDDAIDRDKVQDDPWMAAMRRGDLASAWSICDAVLRRRIETGIRCHRWPRHLQYIWTGAPLEGRRVLVRCYHGLGDTIQFIRFAAPLRRVAREVIIWVQPALLPLIGSAPGVDRAVALHDGLVDIDFDTDIEIMELPHALRTTLTTIPPAPYLSPSWHSPGHGRRAPRVGLVWRAGDWDRNRSVPTPLIVELATAGVELYSLQRGLDQSSISRLPVIDLATDDVSDLAASMVGLDLIISVDTMAAHLAGAMGVPVWTLLCVDCDWRWMEQRCDSPWYPTMRLFRQDRQGDWVPVLDAVRSALQQWVAIRGQWSGTPV
jgi:hypothetical protein